MFDISWYELLVVAAVALIIVGPKDFPVLLRRAGQLIGNMRRMIHSLTTDFREAADISELEELQRQTREIERLAREEEARALSPLTSTPHDRTPS